jgi:hypothetical protein
MKWWIMAVAVCALSCSGERNTPEPASGAAHFEAHERATLAGLAGVFLVVDGITPDLEAIGLQRAGVVGDAEEQLRSGGVRLLSRDEAKSSSGTPYLYINVNAVRGSSELAYSVRIELNQAVRLERATDTRTIAATWQPPAILATAKPADVVSGLRQDLRAAVMQFVNDYRAVNSRS